MYKALQRDESAPPAGFCDPTKSGGIITDMGIHEIDSGSWLLGQDVVEVWAIPGPIVEEHVGSVGDLDNVCIQLRYSGGAIGQIDISRNARYGDDIRFEIVGADAAIFWGDLPRKQFIIGKAGYLEQPTELSFVDRFFPAWTNQVTAFARAIEEGRETEATGEDALIALRTALAAEKSLKTGRPVLVSEI
jgi:predicted dehydrogenase